jgi:acetylornithine deacetylase
MASSPVLETLSALVRINSVNPAYENGRPEAEIIDFVSAFFKERGIETCLQEALPGRPNLIARLPGRNGSRRILFEAHVDTVGTVGMTIPPFEPKIENGRLYGRGSCDVKAGLAALMHAAALLKKEGAIPPCEVWVVAAADEEHSCRGVLALSRGLRAAAAVVAEPTELRVVSASKGCLRWRIRCRGKAAHSSKPHLGVNAIGRMARVLLALEADSETLAGSAHPLVGSPSLSVGVIAGGVQVNIVPEDCSILVDRRLIPGEATGEVLGRYKRLLAGLGFEATMEPPLLEDPTLETPVDSPIVTTASRILREKGLPGEPVGVPYGSDASKLARAGIPSIILGPGSIDQAHAAEEFVECAEVEKALEIYRRLMMEFE